MRCGYFITGSFLVAFAMICATCARADMCAADNEELESEDVTAKEALQGIWIDKETETVLFRAKGDSIYYPDTVNVPVRLFIRQDTLFLAGGEQTAAYPIDRRGEHVFNFHSATGEIVRLVRSQNPGDTVFFTLTQPTTLTYNEVVKKDTVVYYDSERYHCYVYVNPSRLKVYKTSYTDAGLAVENVYYDNVIHICVYKGKKCLFSRDYTKKSFEGLVPDAFLRQAILSNMEFSKADKNGFHFNATVCIPDGASCYMAGICVDYAGKPSMSLLEY